VRATLTVCTPEVGDILWTGGDHLRVLSHQNRVITLRNIESRLVVNLHPENHDYENQPVILVAKADMSRVRLAKPGRSIYLGARE